MAVISVQLFLSLRLGNSREKSITSRVDTHSLANGKTLVLGFSIREMELVQV